MKKIFQKFFSVNRLDLISKFFDLNNPIILEIGVHRSSFSRELYNKFNPQKMFLVDPWKVMDDEIYKDSFYGNSDNNNQVIQDQYYIEVIKNFENEIKDKRVEIFRGTSDNFFLRNKIKFDLIYIDGNHLYEYVKRDISNSLKYLNINGIIVLDDYFVKGWWQDGVTKAVNDFKNNNKIKILEKHSLFNFHNQCVLTKL